MNCPQESDGSTAAAAADAARPLDPRIPGRPRWWCQGGLPGEVDYYWRKLSEGGREMVCGWLKDKYGLSWQVIHPAKASVGYGAPGDKRGEITRILSSSWLAFPRPSRLLVVHHSEPSGARTTARNRPWSPTKCATGTPTGPGQWASS